jgi:retinol dehydrogenase 12
MANDAADLSHQTCLVTGANTGLGKATAQALAQRGAHVILTTRTLAKGQEVADALKSATGNENIEAHALELGNLAKVRQSAEALLARDLPLHVLINNAGIAGPRGLTDDGFELHFGVNHLGPFLFTTLLLERLKASAPARVVTVSSGSHYQAKKGIDFEAQRRPGASVGGFSEYAASKLANVLFTTELARRLEGTGVTTYAVHPGVVATDIWRTLPGPLAFIAKRFMRTPAQGAQTTLYCATDPSLATESGRYYDHCREKRPSKAAQNEALARELWHRSEALLAEALGPP